MIGGAAVPALAERLRAAFGSELALMVGDDRRAERVGQPAYQHAQLLED